MAGFRSEHPSPPADLTPGATASGGLGARDPLHDIRATIQSIESRLQRGRIPAEGLADLKSAIDDARLRVWAALAAAGSDDVDGVLFRFRLRRATEICTSLLDDLETDPLGQHQRELLALRDVAQELARHITQVVRGRPSPS
jgi:hypothetical protein